MLKRVLSVVMTILFFGVSSISAQEKLEIEKLKSNTGISIGEYYKKYQSRVPQKIENAPIIGLEQQKLQTKSTKGLAMPEKFWFPGEFEEVKAIMITWPYVHADKNMQYPVEPVNESLAYWQSNTGRISITEYTSIIDTSLETRRPFIFAELASAIQKGNAEVWINLCNAEDTLALKKYMGDHGMSLTNYRFFINPQNSFWYRDCGPVAFYQGDNDEIAFLDFEYYGGRPADDEIPIRIAEKMNIPVYTTSFEMEGGNIILDGAGTLFTSDQIYGANQDTYGKFVIQNGVGGYLQKASLRIAQIHDTLEHLLNLKRLEVMPALQYDGGTGHIDLYAAMWDENNFVFTQFPEDMSNFTDYRISSENIDSILNLATIHRKWFRGGSIPLPKRDDDTWYTDNSNYAIYTRTYSNSTFVNNVIITPIFSDDNWGAREWDLEAIEVMKKQFPGYEIIPIDIRGYEDDVNNYTGFDGSGGAIHCVTKQIPAENPIRILHGAIQGYSNKYEGKFTIDATITNKSGIKSATCFWRVKGEDNWNTLTLGAVSNNKFSAILNRETNVSIDTIEYYISATSNNGKTITKPFTAPNGYYTFYHGEDAVLGENDREDEPTLFVNINNVDKNNEISIGNFYPNPATEMAQILISDMNQKKMNIQVVNSLGQTIYSNSFVPHDNQMMVQLKTSSFKPGMYFVVFTDDLQRTTVKKLIIQ